jgi:hypothetical protein
MNKREYEVPVLAKRERLTDICAGTEMAVSDGAPLPKGGCFPADDTGR